MDPDIAPLARRLAEENNVEWRRLQGSGTDGRIVERDVLDFLARVMAGEEDVDPTPEPLPDGLQAWTDEAGRPLGPAAPAGAYGGDSARDEAADEDDLLLAGDDLLHEPDTTETEPSAAEEDLLLAGGADAFSAASDRDEQLPDLFDERAAEPRRSDDAPDLFIDDDAGEAELGDRDAETFDFGGLPGADARPYVDRDARPEPDREPTPEPMREAPGDDADALSFGDAEASTVSGREPYAVEPDLDEPDLGEPALDDPASGDGARDAVDVGAVDVDEGDVDAADVDEADLDEVDVPEVDASEAQADEADADEVDLDEADLAAAAPHERPEIDAAPATAITAAMPSVADVRAWPLARTRTVVRRHVDVGGLLSVRRSVALESGMEDLATVAVLYAAALRAADRLDVERPGIALPDGGGQVSVIVPDDAGLAEVGRAVERAARAPERHERADVDLWVVDLSGVGVDEAVLDSDAPQLVLGRLLSDDSDGSVQATISLVADVPVERGAAFLARVADLLEEPLRLLA